MKKLSLFLLALVLVLPVGMVDAQQSKSKSRRKPSKSVGQLQRDLRNVRNNQSRVRKALRETKKAVKAVATDIAVVDNKLNDVENRLQKTTQDLNQNRSRQKSLAVQLEEATDRLAKLKQQVRKRLRRMYVQGDGSFLSVLVGSDSIGDLATRKYVMERVAEQDQKLFTEYKQTRELVTNKKKQQDQVVQRIGTLVRRQAAEHNELEYTKNVKRETLTTLRQKQGELERLLAQFEEDENSIASQIRAYNARVRGGTAVKLPPFSGRFGRPVNGPITSRYGNRFHPILKRNRLHAGIDFGAPHGAPIRAAADGVVISTRYGRGYGNVVMIDHGSGITTVYAHCSSFAVRSGQAVKKGQHIANVGSTGLSTGPHLHFEVWVNGRKVNPLGRF